MHVDELVDGKKGVRERVTHTLACVKGFNDRTQLVIIPYTYTHLLERKPIPEATDYIHTGET